MTSHGCCLCSVDQYSRLGSRHTVNRILCVFPCILFGLIGAVPALLLPTLYTTYYVAEGHACGLPSHSLCRLTAEVTGQWGRSTTHRLTADRVVH